MSFSKEETSFALSSGDRVTSEVKVTAAKEFSEEGFLLYL